MKKFLFCAGLAVAASISYSSCAKKNCYTCSKASLPNVEICDGKYSTSGASLPIPNGASEEDYKKSLEASGYSCSNK